MYPGVKRERLESTRRLRLGAAGTAENKSLTAEEQWSRLWEGRNQSLPRVKVKQPCLSTCDNGSGARTRWLSTNLSTEAVVFYPRAKRNKPFCVALKFFLVKNTVVLNTRLFVQLNISVSCYVYTRSDSYSFWFLCQHMASNQTMETIV